MTCDFLNDGVAAQQNVRTRGSPTYAAFHKVMYLLASSLILATSSSAGVSSFEGITKMEVKCWIRILIVDSSSPHCTQKNAQPHRKPICFEATRGHSQSLTHLDLLLLLLLLAATTAGAERIIDSLD